DLHQPAIQPRLDTMINGVFNNGLQQEAWDAAVFRKGIYLPTYLQSLAQAKLFNVHILPAEVELMGDRHQARSGQAGAEQICQILYHPLGLLGVGADEAGDTVNAVEQKMGTDAG